ncbi:MFS transporter [Micromonospora siamensis]|uniref:Major Facilitator Superfamily protein n=1 Tax=Micromonospora siamensis TaxID=299152 RepID=A0A1C5J3P0_9ACTN|nr:MFS transporter [Micromonospora siamensis]SCG64626.1 Major Facilitator Superfamily protein [Micromonospora siamensis]
MAIIDQEPAVRAGRFRTRLRALVPQTRSQRILAAASFVNQAGSGLFMVSAALYCTRVAGLPLAQIGLAMGIAAGVGLVAGPPVGHLADRRGPREVYRVTLGVQGLAMAALLVAHSFTVVVAALGVGALAGSAGSAARGPLVRGVGGAQLVRYRAYLRSVGNLAGAGAALATGAAVQLDSRAAYLGLIAANAVSFGVAALIITRLPTVPPVPAPPRARRSDALRDRGYLAVTALDALLYLQFHVLIFAVPLWLVERTDAPRWLVGATAFTNTVLVVLLQVPASRGVRDPAAAGAALRRAGLAFLLGMATIAAAAGLAPAAALAAVLLGVVLHTVGELWHTAASLELRFSLAPAHAQGQYAGVAGLGVGLANVAAPPVLALLCLTWGVPGWLLLGGIFAAAGLVAPALVGWAARRRPEASAPAG